MNHAENVISYLATFVYHSLGSYKGGHSSRTNSLAAYKTLKLDGKRPKKDNFLHLYIQEILENNLGSLHTCQSHN
eukprot:c14805_g2_i1 orf=66-290(+)